MIYEEIIVKCIFLFNNTKSSASDIYETTEKLKNCLSKVLAFPDFLGFY